MELYAADEICSLCKQLNVAWNIVKKGDIKAELIQNYLAAILASQMKGYQLFLIHNQRQSN